MGFIIFVPTLSSQAGVQTVKYHYRGLNLFSGWAIINAFSSPLSVTANTTGVIPQYPTLAALNKTIIGMHWTGKTWQNLTQTGWYWDANHSLLYLHFQTWNNDRYHVTEISVDFSVDAVTITETVTETVTVASTVTVTQTVMVTSTITETVTVTMTVTST